VILSAFEITGEAEREEGCLKAYNSIIPGNVKSKR
jgi:hypothetical protein